MKKVIPVFSVMLIMMGVVNFCAISVYADTVEVIDETDDGGDGSSNSGGGNSSSGDCNTNLFGLKPWYNGLTEKVNGRCEIKKPEEGKIPTFVWTIILNIMFDLFAISGYLAVMFIAYGGYQYIFSTGDAGKAAKGKRTVTAAVIGLVIVVLAAVISNFIIDILTK